MKYIEKYWKIIIVGLLVVVFLQCCGGCSKKQQIAFQEQRTEQVADSLNSVIYIRDSVINDLKQQLAVSKESNKQLNDANISLKKTTTKPININIDGKKIN